MDKNILFAYRKPSFSVPLSTEKTTQVGDCSKIPDIKIKNMKDAKFVSKASFMKNI